MRAAAVTASAKLGALSTQAIRLSLTLTTIASRSTTA